MPTRASLWHDEATVIAGNAIAVTIDTGQVGNFYARQNTSTNGDSFSQSFFARAGTYTLAVEGQNNANNGLIDWYIDNVQVVSAQDWYAAAPAKNIIKTATVTVGGDGYHVIKGLINGKNGASGGYNMDLTRYWLRQSAD
jgi:hypothetical protein